MKKINNIFLFLTAAVVVLVSCDAASTFTEPVDDYDHEAQIAKDVDSISNYLKSHYYNATDGAIWTIGSLGDGALPAVDQVALINDSRLEVLTGIEQNDTETDYTMYFLNLQEGSDAEMGKPSPVDNVYVTYSGMTLDSTVFDGNNKTYPVWLSLGSSITGWQYGFQKILGGVKAVSGDPEYVSEEDFRFKGKGEGYLIIPSGLAYRNSGTGTSGFLANESLVFKVELHTISLSDHDGDLIPSRDEIGIDSYGNIELIDTDEDGVPDYVDQDDDGDGILTIDEE